MIQNIKNNSDSQTKSESKENVFFHSLFNRISFKNFTKIDTDILFFIISRLHNKKNKVIKININEILKSLDEKNTKFKNKKRFFANIEKFCDKLQSSFIKNYVVDGKNMDLYRITLFNISSHYENNVLSYLNVKITPEAYKYFNNIHKNFLVGFSLKEFSFITTKSAKNLYRIIKEMECRHFKYINLDSYVFQNIMDIQKSHSSIRSSEISKFYLSPALKELNGLNYKGERYIKDNIGYQPILESVRGEKNTTRKIVGYKFFFENKE